MSTLTNSPTLSNMPVGVVTTKNVSVSFRAALRSAVECGSSTPKNSWAHRHHSAPISFCEPSQFEALAHMAGTPAALFAPRPKAAHLVHKLMSAAPHQPCGDETPACARASRAKAVNSALPLSVMSNISLPRHQAQCIRALLQPATTGSEATIKDAAQRAARLLFACSADSQPQICFVLDPTTFFPAAVVSRDCILLGCAVLPAFVVVIVLITADARVGKCCV